jgi:hypothetical protein
LGWSSRHRTPTQLLYSDPAATPTHLIFFWTIQNWPLRAFLRLVALEGPRGAPAHRHGQPIVWRPMLEREADLTFGVAPETWPGA